MVMWSTETTLQASIGTAPEVPAPECPEGLAPQFGALIGCSTRPLKEPGCACGAVLAIFAQRFGHSGCSGLGGWLRIGRASLRKS